MRENLSVPWVERYRPKTIDELIFQGNNENLMHKALTNKNIPHFLFHGPPGTGKTSTAHAIAIQLYGQKYSINQVMELNASDERGINVVREKIKHFASNTIRVYSYSNNSPT